MTEKPRLTEPEVFVLADHALNEVRNLDALVRADEKAVREFEAVAGNRAGEVHSAVIRFQLSR